MHQGRLWTVVIFQLASGIAFGVWHAVEGSLPFIYDEVLLVPLLGFALSQASLLGVWAAFSRIHWFVRAAAVGVGAIYLESLLFLGTSDDDFVLLPTTTLAVTAVALRAIRWRRVDLRCLSSDEQGLEHKSVRFSIKGLMLLTLLAAVATVAAKEFYLAVGAGSVVAFMVGWGFGAACLTTAAVWAALGPARPWLRSAGVVLAAKAVAGLLAFILDERDAYFYLLTIEAMHVVLVLGSLIAVRSCGYRVLARTASGA